MTSIRKSLKSGIIYTALAKYSGIFISILVGAVLARILTPEEFGIVALVTVFVTFFNLLSDFGLGPAVVQSQNLTKEDIYSIFSFSILVGLFLASVFFLSAPIISKFYQKVELVAVSRWLSLAVLFYSLQVIPKALFQKALDFKQIGITIVCVQTFCGIIAIVMAYQGFSYYALVTQSILVSGISFIIFYSIKPITLARRINLASIQKVIRFSLFQFMFNFINFFSRNLDNILIGKFFNSSALGYYDKSYRLMMMPVQNLTHVITPVLLPVLSIYQDDKSVIFNTYLKVAKILSYIGFPLSVFLFFSAEEIINVLYGPLWEQSIPVFKLLSCTIGLQMVLSSSGSIFQAVNRTDLLFYSGILSAVILVSGIAYGIFVGNSLESIGFGLIIAFAVNFFLNFFILIHLALGKSFFKFLYAISFSIVIAVFISLLLWVSGKFLPANMLLSLLFKFSLTGVGMIVLLMGKRDSRLEIVKRLKELNKK